MKTYNKLILVVFTATLLFTACKPTEAGYRSAYEAAKAKREAANAEAMIPTTGLLSDDGPVIKMVEGDTIFISRDRLRRMKTQADSIAPLSAYSVAVGVFKMHTNAEATARRLESSGYQARAVQTTGDRWYAIAGTFGNLKEAKDFIEAYKKRNPDYPYIGLPGAPVVIVK